MKNFVKLIFFIFIICPSNYTIAQAVKFEKVYGGTGYDYGHSVAQTFDKGYVIAGATTSFGVGSTDAYILKTDSMGVVLWQKTFGGINIDQFYSIKETSDSGFVMAGFTNSEGNGGYDMYVVKTDKNGDSLWTKSFGGTNWDFAYSVEQTSDGGYIIAGATYSYGNGNTDIITFCVVDDDAGLYFLYSDALSCFYDAFFVDCEFDHHHQVWMVEF